MVNPLLDIILILTLIEPLILMLQIGVEYSVNSGTLHTKYTFCSSKIIGNRWSRTSPLLLKETIYDTTTWFINSTCLEQALIVQKWCLYGM